VLYHGLEVLGRRLDSAGLVLGSIGAFVIERKFTKASAFAAAGALLTFFGFMHGESIGLCRDPDGGGGHTPFVGGPPLRFGPLPGIHLGRDYAPKKRSRIRLNDET